MYPSCPVTSTLIGELQACSIDAFWPRCLPDKRIWLSCAGTAAVTVSLAVIAAKGARVPERILRLRYRGKVDCARGRQASRVSAQWQPFERKAHVRCQRLFPPCEVGCVADSRQIAACERTKYLELFEDEKPSPERFVKTPKVDAISLMEYESLENVGSDVPGFIDQVYNAPTLHSAIAYLRPSLFGEQQPPPTPTKFST